jgi:sigma-E factor negative regulatory protein RseB
MSSRIALMALAFALSAGAAQADGALGLLVAAQRAQATQAFEGVAVFMHDGKFDAVRVVHHPGNGGYQHLTSLSGMPRALFRDAREVRVELPGGAHRLAPIVVARQAFDATRVAASYQLGEAGSERIAGFTARVVDAIARDQQRYSQRLWINPDSGMLLGVAMIGPRQETLQQVMFTSLTVAAGNSTTAEGTNPSVATEVPEAMKFAVPAGFRLIAERREGERRSLIMSDGLAMITLYLETRADALDRMTTLRRGATQLVARQLGHDRAVVVGEVPLATAVDLANRAALATND